MSINMGYIMIHPKNPCRLPIVNPFCSLMCIEVIGCQLYTGVHGVGSRRFDVNPVQIQTCATRRLTMMSIPPMKLKKKKKMMKTFRAKNEKRCKHVISMEISEEIIIIKYWIYGKE